MLFVSATIRTEFSIVIFGIQFIKWLSQNKHFPWFEKF